MYCTNTSTRPCQPGTDKVGIGVGVGIGSSLGAGPASMYPCTGAAPKTDLATVLPTCWSVLVGTCPTLPRQLAPKARHQAEPATHTGSPAKNSGHEVPTHVLRDAAPG